MNNWRISRRTFISGLGVAFTLPLLESLAPRRAKAAGASDPRRFVSLYMPSGTYNVKGDAVWYPAAGALTKNLPLVLSPFAANIGDFSVLMHPRCSARDNTGSSFYQITGRGAGHVSAVTTWLSQTGLTDPNSSQCSVPGSSFDQMVADANKGSVLVMSGGCSSGSVDNTPFDYSNYVSYKSGQPLEPHKNPVDLYKNVFAGLVSTGGSTPPPPPPASAAARNHSILDGAVGDIAELQGKLGKNDRAKLDDYFTSIRNLETKLYNAGVPVGGGCTGGMVPDASVDNVDQNGDLSASYITRVQAFFDMIVLAFKCDLVRAVSFMYDGDGCQRHFNGAVPPGLVYGNVSLTAELHTGISHYGQNDNGREKCITRDRFYMALMTYLLNGLKGATDPSGSPILDNTIVLGGFNVVDGNHNDGQEEGVPMVVGGGRNFMHPGNCFDLAGADMKDLFYTFSTYLNMGVPNYQGSTKVLAI